jgi:hypothetical protein
MGQQELKFYRLVMDFIESRLTIVDFSLLMGASPQKKNSGITSAVCIVFLMVFSACVDVIIRSKRGRGHPQVDLSISSLNNICMDS